MTKKAYGQRRHLRRDHGFSTVTTKYTLKDDKGRDVEQEGEMSIQEASKSAIVKEHARAHGQ